MQRIFHTPEGVRDIYGEECGQKRRLQEKLHRVFHRYGFRDIETPSIEYFEVFSKEVGTIPSRELYKFFDREGNTLVLRPDFTPSVARACATYFSPDQEVVSLCYTGNTFINNSEFRGRLKETTQMGVERMGDDSPAADAEILALTVECLLEAGITEFQVSVGQVDYFRSLLAEADFDEEEEESLRSLISRKNDFGVEEFLRGKALKPELIRVLGRLPRMFGSEGVLKEARELTDNPRALAAIARLEQIYRLMKVYGYEKYIAFDLASLSKYHYYTGIIFQAYTFGTGEPLVKGGRYNDLMKHFGKPAPAVGCAIMVDSLFQALSRQKIPLPTGEDFVELSYLAQEEEKAIREAVALRRQGKNVALCRKKQETAGAAAPGEISEAPSVQEGGRKL